MGKRLLLIATFLFLPLAYAGEVFIDGNEYSDVDVIQLNGLSSEPSTAPLNNARMYYNSSDNKVYLSKNGGSYEELGAGGASSFTDLTDTPSSYSGQAGKYIKVKSDESGLEFDTPSGSGDITAVGDVGSGDAFTADGEGNTLYFEGSTADAYETILQGQDVTSDITINLPSSSGTLLNKEQIDTEAEFESLLFSVFTPSDGSLSDDDLSDNSINDLNDVDTTGWAEGKLLKFDASGNLVVGTDNDTTYSAGTGLSLSGTTFSLSHLGLENLSDPNANRLYYWNDANNTTEWLDYSNWDTDKTDDLTTSTTFGGDVSGTYDNLQLGSGVVTTTEIADGTIQNTDIADDTISEAKLDIYNAPTDGYYLKWDDTNGMMWAAVSGGGGGEVQMTFSPQAAKLPSSNYAQIDGGENNWRLLFDDSTDESAVWQDVLDDDYGGGTLYVDIYFTMTSATSGSVVWNVQIMAVTPGDTEDVNADGYDAVNSVTVSVPSTAGHLAKATVTLTNADGISAGDYFRLKLTRDADNANDDATGDAEVIGIVLRE